MNAPLHVEQSDAMRGFVTSPWIPAAQFAQLRERPGMPSAVASLAGSLIALYEGNTLLNTLLCDRGRVLIGLFVLYLDVLPLEEHGRPGATLSAVQTLCRQSGICSAGRATSVLAAMRFGGYVTIRRDAQDARRRLLTPTHKLLMANQRHRVQMFRALAPLLPGAAAVPDRLDQVDFRTAFLLHLGRRFIMGFRVVNHVPVLAPLVESNAGLMIMSSIALQHLDGRLLPGQPVPVSVSALARRFSVSRAHVRGMLALSERRGLLMRLPSTEQALVQRALVEALLQFYGAMFLLFYQSAMDAWRDVGDGR